jgi:hypothetical protein
MQLALDVSAGTGKSLTAVSMALSRAMNGNTMALNRIVPEAKNVTDKMGYMEKVFGGAAQAAANSDPYARMNVIFSEMYESIGYAIIPVLNQFADWLTSMLPKVQNFFAQLTDPTTEVGSVWKSMIDTIGSLFNWITANISAIVRWGTALLILWGIFKAGAVVVMVYKTAVELAKIAQIALNLAMDANPILLVLSGLALLTAGLWAYTTAAEAANSVDQVGQDNAYTDAINAYDEAMAQKAKQKVLDNYALNYAKLHPETSLKITPEMADPTSDFYHYIQEGYKVGDIIPGLLPYNEGLKAAIAGDKAYLDELDRLRNARAARQANNGVLPGGKMSGLEQYLNSFAVTPENFLEQKLGRIEGAVVKKASEIQGEIVKSLNAGEITETAATALSLYADKEMTILAKLGKARDTLAEKYNLAKSLIGSVGDSIKKMLNISDLGTTADSVIAKFKAVTNQVLSFAKNLKSLKDRGVSTDFISQIASAGVETGSALAQGLSTATPEQIAAVNQAFATVQEASSAASESIAQTVYGYGVDVTNGLLAGIVSQDKVLLSTATSMGYRFSKTFAAAAKAATASKDDKAFLKLMAKYEVDNLPAGLVLPTTPATSTGNVSLVNNYSVDVSAQTSASPSDIANQTMSAIKFGLPTGVTLTGTN